MNKKAGWQHFQHEADIGVRGYGVSLEQAFSQAAIAMMAVITDPELINTDQCIEVECAATDTEYLFTEWLNTLVYEMAVRKMLFSQFDIKIENGHLKATICGEAIDRQKHKPAVEIKGATLTELQVTQDAAGNWLAQCIVDV